MTQKITGGTVKGAMKHRMDAGSLRDTKRYRIASRASWIGAAFMILGFGAIVRSPAHTLLVGVCVSIAGVLGIVALCLFLTLMPRIIFTEKFRRELRTSTYVVWLSRRVIKRFVGLSNEPLPHTIEERWAEYYTDGPGNPEVQARLRRSAMRAVVVGIVIGTLSIGTLVGIGLMVSR